MSLQDDDLERHRQQTVARNASTASSVRKRKGSPCSEDGCGDSQAAKILRYSTRDLPEDIWRHIHSLMPLRDAARAACVSRAFLCSWRCLPSLIFNEYTLRSKVHALEQDFRHTINRILRKHSGIGLKILKLEFCDIAYSDLDDWLQVAVKPGIEELTVMLYRLDMLYDFPCQLLSEGIRNSIRSLEVGSCAFHPTAELGTLRSLTTLRLYLVPIEEDELERLLSNSPVLELLDIDHCDEIISLKLPCVLERLICVKAKLCRRLRVIKNRTPNLSSLYIIGKVTITGDTLQVKNLSMYRSKAVCYSRAKLPSIMRNLETLRIRSYGEAVNTPMLPTKLVHLKHLDIYMRSARVSLPYDYFSLVSFLDASPSLETLSLDVSMEIAKHESVIGHSSQWRQMGEHPHFSLKSVKIIGFSSAKSLAELTCYILQNAVLLDCLKLDTLYGSRCSDKNCNRCSYVSKDMMIEASKALAAIRTYIEGKVPTKVKLIVLEPCKRCHAFVQERGRQVPFNLPQAT